MQKEWWKQAVVYQIYPRSFQDSNGDGIGDIQGLLQRLDYLKTLGVDVLWLCPIYDSPNDDNGYDICDYQAILKEFGTMEDVLLLIHEVHQRGMKLIMDLVVNHTSDEHMWFQESRKSKTNPYRDYYIWRDPVDGHEPNPWHSNFGGSAWTYDALTQQYYLHLFSSKQPDLNWDHEPLRQAIYKMMRWWLDQGIDGFRMDVISYISKDEKALIDPHQPTHTTAANGPHVHEYLQEMHREVLAKYDVMSVGENPDASVEEAKRYAGFDTKELNMIFQFELMDIDGGETSRWYPKSIELSAIKRIQSHWQKGLDGVAWNSLFWNNHDQPRVVSRFGNDTTEFYREKSAKMLAVCLHMMQGTPYIYQGEEIGMCNTCFSSIEEYNDIDSLHAYEEMIASGRDPKEMLEVIQYRSRDNARTPMQWNTKENAGFTTGTPWLKVNDNYTMINVESALQDPNSIFYTYQKLIALRKEIPCIVYGNYEDIHMEHSSIYVYKRCFQKEELLVLCNFTSTIQSIPKDCILERSAILLDTYDVYESDVLQPYEARVYYSKY